MTYNIDFDERALKEWQKLGSDIREQFKKKLKKLQSSPMLNQPAYKGIYLGAIRLNCGHQVTVWCIKLLILKLLSWSFQWVNEKQVKLTQRQTQELRKG
ncbi:hypothetical protein NVI2019_GHJFPKLH_03350 [Providencia alcalifaciens]|nr:hypothetical protein NVI2019_GHJFPKLH_03350 [Providencia alcalifaciens]